MGMPLDQPPPPPTQHRGPPPRAASLYNCLAPGAAPATNASGTSAADRPAALRHAECPICFEPLHKAPVGFCPMTRASIASVLPVPSILTDPEGWFRAVDIDGDGRLSVLEVVECLKAQLPVDNAALDAAAADRNHWMWQQWDSDRSGFIERNELLDPNGLVAYVRSAFAKAGDAGPPDIQ